MRHAPPTPKDLQDLHHTQIDKHYRPTQSHAQLVLSFQSPNFYHRDLSDPSTSVRLEDFCICANQFHLALMPLFPFLIPSTLCYESVSIQMILQMFSAHITLTHEFTLLLLIVSIDVFPWKETPISDPLFACILPLFCPLPPLSSDSAILSLVPPLPPCYPETKKNRMIFSVGDIHSRFAFSYRIKTAQDLFTQLLCGFPYMEAMMMPYMALLWYGREEG